MKIATREERLHAEANRLVIPSEVEGSRGVAFTLRIGVLRLRFAALRMTAKKSPREHHRRLPVRNKDFLFNDQIVRQAISPARPRCILKLFDACGAIRADDVRRVAWLRTSKRSVRRCA